uniref:Uncharacterized protein n=1 Tax=uncultured Latescibacterota bacterium TaxID=199737 RepID=Q2YZW3_9BACT|nr:hypothetical protein [uncultured Latescibacterota bacterium]
MLFESLVTEEPDMTRPMSIIGAVGVVIAFTLIGSSTALAQASPPLIEHTPITGPVPANQAIPIAATVTDADPADSVLTVQVNFLRGMDPPKFFPLTPQGGGLYEGIIPAGEILPPGFAYRIEARDPSDSLSIYPPPAQPDIWVEVAGGTGSPPVITHTPLAGPLPANEAVEIRAVVTDPDGNETLDRVFVEIYVEGPPMEFAMAPTGQPNEFGALIPAGVVQPPGIEYRVIAEDTDANATGHPAFQEIGHWAAVSTGGGTGSPPAIAHTLIAGPVPAGQPVNIAAVVTDPDGNETIDEVLVEVSRGGAPLHFPLSPGGEPNQFVGQIPPSEVVNPGFSYRVIARDTQGLDSATPGFQSDPQWVTVSAGGGAAPQIAHTPLPSPQPPGVAIIVTADVTDVDGDLDAVGFEIHKEGVPPTYYAMTPLSGNTYQGTIPAAAVASPGFGYRIVAEDVANNVNSQPAFAYDPYWVTVSSGSGSPPVVTHTPIAGPLPINQPVVVTATVTDADGNETVTEVRIEMSRGGPPMIFVMSPTGTANSWSGSLPAGEVLDPGFSYRIVAEDNTANVTAKPAFQYDPYWVDVTSGTGGGSPPDITHTPVASPKPPATAIPVTATVTDPDGDLKKVGIELERAGAPPTFYPMSLTSKGIYEGTIPAGDAVAPGFEYRIVAEDSLMNVRAKPAFNYDPYWVAVGSGGGTGSPPSITHTPLAGPLPVGQPVEVRARVTDPDGDTIDFVDVEFSNGGSPMIFGMGPDVDPGWYITTIPGGEVFTPGFEYRIVAEDSSGSVGANPGFQSMPYWVDVSSGTGGGSAPTITHTPLTSPKPQMVMIEVTATVADVDGDLTNVGIEFERPGAPPARFPMMLDAGNLYRGTIPSGEVIPPGFNYRIVAEDANFNTGGNPGFSYGPYWIDVSSGEATEGNPPIITHTPIPSPQPQGMAITVMAAVSDPDVGDTITNVEMEVYRDGPPMHFPMTFDAGAGAYVGTIPASDAMPPGFDYRVIAQDAQGHVRGNPQFQYPPYWVEVSWGEGGGGTKPVITFTPLPSPQPPYTQIQVTVTVTDVDGDLREVGIETNRPDAPPNYYMLNPIGGNQYQGYIMAGDVVSPGFGYRILAEDVAYNMAAKPEFQYDPYWVDVGTGGATEGNPPVITHTPIPSPQAQGAAISVTATVTDPDVGDTITMVEIELSRGGPPMHFPMALQAKGAYVGQIPPSEVIAPGFEYRVVAHDAQGHVRGNPVFSVAPYWIEVSGGTSGGSRPEITFTPLASPKPPGVNISVSATVVDPDGDLRDVGIEITRPGMPPMWYMLNPAGANVFTGTIFGGDVQPPGFSYRVMAKDMNFNEAARPEWNYDPYWVDVGTGEATEGNPPTITHTQIASPQPQGVMIHVTARVTDPDTSDTITDVHIELSRGGPPMFFPMWLDPATGDYVGDIPGPEVMPPGFDYRVVASDAQGHVKGKPAFIYSPYWVEVSWGDGGGSRPTVTFAPITSPRAPWLDVVVQATVTDPDGDLMEVGIDFSRPGMPPMWYMLNPIGNNVYEGRIFGGDVQSPGFSYRIIARDMVWNETAKPEWNYDPYWVDVGTGTPVEGNPPTITHSPIPSPQSQGTIITVTATVADPDTGDTITNVHIELSHGGPPLNFPMMYDATTGTYTGQIPGPEVMPPGFEYRVVASDAQGHTKGNPAFANPPYWVEVSWGDGGGSRPTVTFAPITSPRAPWLDVVVQATVTDPDGDLMEVGIDFSRPGMPPMWYMLNPIGNNVYEGRIFGGDVQSPGFSYRIIARDMVWNETAKPEWNYDPYWVDVGTGTPIEGNPPTITHSPIPSPQNQGTNITVAATVTDPDAGDTITNVHIELSHGGPPLNFPMMYDATTGTYTGQIPGPEVMPPGFDYRVMASDAQGHTRAKPDFQNAPYWTEVSWGGGGGSRPEVTVTPLTSPKPPWQDVVVQATVTDVDGDIMEVGVDVSRPGMPPMWYMLNPIGNNVYEGRIFGGDVQSPGFSYRIIARDMVWNETARPEWNYDPYWVDVGTGTPTEGNPPTITHSPIPSPQNQGTNITVTATVTDPDAGDTVTNVHIELSHGGPPLHFPMNYDATTGKYTGQIPGPEVMPPGFDYRVVANDAQGHTKGSPAFANSPYWTEVSWGGGGGSRPEVTVTPLTSPKPPWQDIIVRATVTDVDGDLMEVGVDVSRPNMPPMWYMLNPIGNNVYEGRIFGGDVQPPGFNYRIIARDMVWNETAKPAWNYDPYWVDVSTGGTSGGNPPSITHTPLPSPKPMGQIIRVTARVTDPDTADTITDVHIELSRGGPPMFFPMWRDATTGDYVGDIPGPEVMPPGFDYRVVANDAQGHVKAKPEFQNPPYWVQVGGGAGGGSQPEITFTPLASPKPPWQDINVSATVTDPDGNLMEVGIEISRPNMPPMFFMMNPAGNNVYQGMIWSGDVQPPGFNYRIIARDTNFNETAKPAFNYDPYWVEVRTGGTVEGNPPSITHTPLPSPKPMGQVIRVTARVTDPDTADTITDVHIELSRGGPPMFFPMWLDPATGDYAGDIPGPEVMAPGFNYRVVANDAQGHVKASPQFQNPSYWVEVGWSGGGGGSRPEITFAPLASPKLPWQDISVTATVLDPDGDLREVGIEINRPGMPPMFFMLNPMGGGQYQGMIWGGDVQPPGFNYRIVAKDMNFNDAAKPAFNYDPYWVDVGTGGVAGGNPPQITHTPIQSPKPMGQNIRVTARVADPDSGDVVGEVHVELSHGGPPMHFPMWLDPATGDYVGDIPGNEVMAPGFDYRVVASDTRGLVRANPRFQDPPYWVEVGWSGGGTGSRPEITFTPLASPKPPWQDIVITATVTDPDGDLRDVGIEINRPGMPIMFFPLNPMGAGQYQGMIWGGDVQPPGFNYRIVAKDMTFNDAAKPAFNYDPYWVDVSTGGGSGGNPPEVTHSPLPSPQADGTEYSRHGAGHGSGQWRCRHRSPPRSVSNGPAYEFPDVARPGDR